MNRGPTWTETILLVALVFNFAVDCGYGAGQKMGDIYVDQECADRMEVAKCEVPDPTNDN